MPKTKVSYRKAIYSALDDLMKEDERVVLLGEDITEYGGAFGVTADLHEKHPARVIATPISEGGFTGVGVGLAMTGYRVVVELMFMDFLTLAMDQLVNHAANVHYMYGGQLSCPMVVRTPAGGYRGYGASHSKSLEACIMSAPGIKIVAPYTVEDAYSLLVAAVYDNNPVVFVEHKLLYDTTTEVELDRFKVGELGKARVAREGRDLTIVAHSYGVGIALDAAATLAENGVEAEVIDLRTLKPLDTETIVSSVKKTGRLVSIEEGTMFGGVGAEVTSQVVENCIEYIDGRITRVGKADVPIPAALGAERGLLPSPTAVVEAAKRSLSWG